jgi:pilus assembly protein CpaE
MLLSHSDNSRNDAIDTAAPLSVVTMAFDRDTQRLLKIWLPSLNVREMMDYAEGASFLEDSGNGGVDVCIIDFDRDPAEALQSAEQIHTGNAEIAIFAVSSDAQPDIIIQAMRSGCREYLFKPLVREQLLQAVSRVGSRRRERKERSTAQVLTFIGAKGGCGTTTLATQIGTLLAGGRSRKTLLLDLHPTLGDAALYLGFTATRYHSYELMENTDRLDPALLQSMALHHSSGLDIVPAPADFESARHAASGSMAQTFNALRDWYDFILVDAPAGLNDETAKLIGYSDWVYIVTVAEVSALRNVSRIVDYVKQEEIPQEKIRLVLNRFDKRSPINEAQIEKVTQQKIFWSVPNQYFQAVKTITASDSAANLRSDLMRNLKEWVDSVVGAKVEADAKAVIKKKRGILGLFGDSK